MSPTDRYGTRCRGADCAAEIGMVLLGNGKWHPVESLTPERYRVYLDKAVEIPAAAKGAGTWEWKRQVLIVDRIIVTTWLLVVDGRVVEGPATVEGLESHYASCPNAEEFRRPKGEGARR